MNTQRFSFLLIVLFVVFLSCSKNDKHAEVIFSEVGKLVEQLPDSALVLLDSIRNPYELNEKQFAEYHLFLIQAKDKCYKDISNDTLIFQLKDFDNLDKKALAKFYCGRVHHSRGEYEKATQAYLEAGMMAREIKDISLTGLSEFFLGELYYNQRLFDAAILHYKQAASNFFHLSNKYKSQIASYNQVGNCYLLKQHSDSAFLYYEKGLNLAKLQNDSIEQIDMKQNIGVAFLELTNMNKAREMLYQALSLSTNNTQRAKIYLNLAEMFHSINRKDSALLYSNLSLKLSDKNVHLQACNYKLLSTIEEKSENYQKGLENYHLYANCISEILSENKNSNILEIQKKYNFELIQNANNKLLIERQWIFIGFIVLAGIFFFFFYRNRMKNRRALLTATQQIYQLKGMVEKVEKSENSTNANNSKLQHILFQLLDTFKRITLLEGYLRDEEKENGQVMLKKVNEIIYRQSDQFDWDVFYQPVNALYDDYLTRLKELFPQLSETEVLICCLTKVDFDNTEISLLMKSTPNAILKRKSIIRQKIGMKEKENFVKQLDKLVKKG